ncbi:hypothetical protein Droror1_Dr00011492 [Drosera rotundifolia]
MGFRRWRGEEVKGRVRVLVLEKMMMESWAEFWVMLLYHTIIIFTYLQIYGDGSASAKDCFRMFNPTDLATFNKVLNDWSAAFFSIFMLGPQRVSKIKGKTESDQDKWVSMDEYLEGYLIARRSRYSKKTEVFELGFQEIRTYYRLFMLSFVLLMFMFCTRISRTKFHRPTVSSTPV